MKAIHHIDGTENNDISNLLMVNLREKGRPMDKVELYEDNAGHLFLVHGNKVWGELERTESAFDEDARAILDGETDGWTIPVYSLNENKVNVYADLVASFDDAYVTTMHRRPGIAASQYILDEMDYPDWGVAGGVMHVYREGQREIRFPYEEMVWSNQPKHS